MKKKKKTKNKLHKVPDFYVTNYLLYFCATFPVINHYKRKCSVSRCEPEPA